jgi:uncharacterized protein YkwD
VPTLHRIEMKSIGLKFITIALLVAMIFIVSPRVLPLVHRVFAPPVAPEIKPVLPPPGVKYLDQVEDLMFEMTNQARRAKGLAPLVKDEELRQAARAYSNDMLVRRFFDHTTPDGVSFDERLSNGYHHWVYVMGENIWSADGYNPREIQRVAKLIFTDWMSSPEHRENMLDPDFTNLGVGVAARHDQIRATQEFVKRPQYFIFGARG